MLKGRGTTRFLFGTVTFKKPVRSVKRAQQELNSFLNAVRKRYGGYLWVLEAHQSGGVHYHPLIPVNLDCHAGTDLDAWSEKFVPIENMYFRSANPAWCGRSTRDTYLYNSMNPALHAESDWWQAAAKAHGFDRVQPSTHHAAAT